jgi:O-antigen ligase
MLTFLRAWLADGARTFATRPRFLVLASFLFAGDLKASPQLSWVPVDLTLLTGFLLAMVILARILRGWRAPSLRPLALVGSWFLTFLTGVFQAVDSEYGNQKIITLFTLTLLAALAPIFLVKTEEDLVRLLNAMAWFCLLIAIEGMLTVTGLSHRTMRLEVFGAGTISLGRASGLLFLFASIQLFRRASNQVLSFGLMALAAVTALFSGSRGPIVSALLVAMILFGLGRQSLGVLRVRLAVAAGLVVFLLASSLSLAPAASLRRVETFAHGEYGPSEQFRVTALQASWVYLKDAPLGVGWGGFGTHVNPLNGLGRQYAHNLLAEVTLESGWVSGAFTLLILGVALLSAWSRTLHQGGRLVFAGLLFYLINALVSGDINDNRPLFMFVTSALMLLDVPVVPLG